MLVYGIWDRPVGILDCLTSPRKEKDAFIWQQSQEPAIRLIERYTSPGDVIVDPFAGSGTFVFAAERLGRIGIGSEIKLG